MKNEPFHTSLKPSVFVRPKFAHLSPAAVSYAKVLGHMSVLTNVGAWPLLTALDCTDNVPCVSWPFDLSTDQSLPEDVALSEMSQGLFEHICFCCCFG